MAIKAADLKVRVDPSLRKNRVRGFRIVTDPNTERVVHIYDPETGVDINNMVMSGTINLEPGNVTATLHVLVSEVNVIARNVEMVEERN